MLFCLPFTRGGPQLVIILITFNFSSLPSWLVKLLSETGKAQVLLQAHVPFCFRYVKDRPTHRGGVEAIIQLSSARSLGEGSRRWHRDWRNIPALGHAALGPGSRNCFGGIRH